MPIEIPKEARAQAIASLRRYFEENFEPVGEMAAGQLVNFFLEEIGPLVYNRAVRDAEARIERHLSDLAADLSTPEFQYWPKLEARRRNAR